MRTAVLLMKLLCRRCRKMDVDGRQSKAKVWNCASVVVLKLLLFVLFCLDPHLHHALFDYRVELCPLHTRAGRQNDHMLCVHLQSFVCAHG